ncbi:hypothetical protein H2198_009634 [Neophaeococcomyces mojaviensis]|uniref:Uncharacterized protein n=1 Tax=Neophaeococcomyces mojaviensis TaxID=3383035 RepID=A0ACC2ZU57_9EURO|nr:hypothetical protein H2198_009634 [Knufia sp. JES_112]
MKRAIRRFLQPTVVDDENSEINATKNLEEHSAYNKKVDEIRDTEYPTLSGTTYLDHAGTTPYPRSAIESWTLELTTNLFGNPHSASASSQLSTRRVDDIRVKVLNFFHASPEDFDVVFVANATAAIKLVVEAFRDHRSGFWYGYHADSHTSLVGCRELATKGSRCFEDDQSVREWISALQQDTRLTGDLSIFAYPGQSNMTGRRLPLEWSHNIRRYAAQCGKQIYTLLDAASLVSTCPLDLSDAAAAPDFTALSFYKIFGFPDLGALIVRKQSAELLLRKRYFAGGTVDAVVSSAEPWHAKKNSIHGALEEGTLPFHNILALDHVMSVHEKLFGSMAGVSHHAGYLAQEARSFLKRACHANGSEVCEIYGATSEAAFGPLIAFNLKDGLGKFISASEVEKLSIVKGIQLRTGGMCNPGGIAKHLNLSAEQIRSNYDAGYRCGGESDLVDGNPVGAIRISFGAMSTRSDLETFKAFIEEYYVERNVLQAPPATFDSQTQRSSFFVESISVFPIKSCAAFKLSAGQQWLVTLKGLAWDREWCLVHEGTNVALSQKRYPRLSLLRPSLDLVNRKLTVSYVVADTTKQIEINIDETLSAATSSARTCPNDAFRLSKSKVCGDTIPVHVYTSQIVNSFFSDALGVPCSLARYSRTDTSRVTNIRRPHSSPSSTKTFPGRSISSSQLMLANESPMLIVSRSSVNELNRQIRNNALEKGRDAKDIKTVSADSFRGNIVVAQRSQTESSTDETPYYEDDWTSVTIGARQSSPRPTNPKQRSNASTSSSHFDISSGTSETTSSMPGSFDSTNTGIDTDIGVNHDKMDTSHNVTESQQKPIPVTLDILGPCQRCQMISIDQTTAESQAEPFSTLAKSRRKGDGRIWFGVHAALAESSTHGSGELYIRIGDLVSPS